LDTEFASVNQTLCGDINSRLSSTANGGGLNDLNVVRVTIDLGYWLELLSTTGIEAVQAGYESFCQVIAASGGKLPINTGGHDLLLRKLDYAVSVINHVHASLKQGAPQAFDTRCCAFIGRDHRNENSGFYRKTRAFCI
jgi:hypothetical protein